MGKIHLKLNSGNAITCQCTFLFYYSEALPHGNLGENRMLFAALLRIRKRNPLEQIWINLDLNIQKNLRLGV